MKYNVIKTIENEKYYYSYKNELILVVAPDHIMINCNINNNAMLHIINELFIYENINLTCQDIKKEYKLQNKNILHVKNYPVVLV